MTPNHGPRPHPTPTEGFAPGPAPFKRPYFMLYRRPKILRLYSHRLSLHRIIDRAGSRDETKSGISIQ